MLVKRHNFVQRAFSYSSIDSFLSYQGRKPVLVTDRRLVTSVRFEPYKGIQQLVACEPRMCVHGQGLISLP